MRRDCRGDREKIVLRPPVVLYGYCSKTRHGGRHLAVRLTIDVYAAIILFFKPRWHDAAIAPKLATAKAKGESRHVLRARLRKKSPRERQPKQDVRRSEGKREKLSYRCTKIGTSMFRFPTEGNKNPCRESFGGVEPFPKGSTKIAPPFPKGSTKKTRPHVTLLRKKISITIKTKTER